MNRIELISKLKVEYDFYNEWLNNNGHKEYSSTVYNGTRIKTTYKEVIIPLYNDLKMVNIDSTTKDINTFYEGLKKINSTLKRMI